jgi:dihydropteroate synthase type 2
MGIAREVRVMGQYLDSSPADIRRPVLVGIVNITADSFSDGGRFLDPNAALAHARRLRAEGADIIELGPASSHPDAAPVTAVEECRRLTPVLDALAADGTAVSVDSPRSQTQHLALARRVAYLNDIQGFPDPDQYAALAASDCQLIVMHSVQRRGNATRVHTDPDTVWARVDRFFAGRLARLEAAGIRRDRLILDPGLGFFLGANPEPSLVVLGGIGRLRARFGVRVMVSPSRKSFLRALTGTAAHQIGAATLAAEIYAAFAGVNYIRTHDVQAVRDALTVLHGLHVHGCGLRQRFDLRWS